MNTSERAQGQRRRITPLEAAHPFGTPCQKYHTPSRERPAARRSWSDWIGPLAIVLPLLGAAAMFVHAIVTSR
jgi:hypothetical protein